MFSLDSFSRLYNKHFPTVDPSRLKCVLWGDYSYDKVNKKFVKKQPGMKEIRKRTFVEFILEPIYKIFSHVVGKDKPELEPFLNQIGVILRN